MRKKYKQQDDRLLKQLSYVERKRQERIRARVTIEFTDLLATA